MNMGEAYLKFHEAERQLLLEQHFSEATLKHYLDTLADLNAQSPVDSLIQCYYPGIQYPMHLRAKTSDIHNFYQLLVLNEYGAIQLTDPKIIIDLGAYVGYAAIYFASRYPQCKIICVEPSKRNYELLKINTKPYPNIHIINTAIWSHSTSLKITGNVGGDWGTIVSECAPNDEGAFAALALEDLILQNDIQKIDLLKVDIEGSEKQLFCNNTQGWLKMVEWVSCETHDRFIPGCSQAYFELFESTGHFEKIQSGEYFIFRKNHGATLPV